MKVVFDFIYYATAFIWYLPRRYLNGRIARLLGDAVTAATHGLSAADVQGARIETSCHVGITHVFSEEFWDVSEVALRAPLAAPATADRKRYDFLVDQNELKQRRETEERVPASRWLRVKRNLGSLYERYVNSFAFDEDSAKRQPLARSEYEDEVARIWFTLIERFREASGAVELVHSVYYSTPEVEDGIAKFIATGSRHVSDGRP